MAVMQHVIRHRISSWALEQAARKLTKTSFQPSEDEELINDILNTRGRDKLYALGEAGQFLGALLYRRLPDKMEIYITTLFVMPEARSKGVGSTLLEHAKRKAQSLGYRRMTLKPFMDVVPFYLNRGFAFTEDRACTISI